MIIIIAFLIIIAIETWLTSLLFHNIYRLSYGKTRYEGVKPLEIVLIFLATAPGLLGCARGGFGIGLPIPLIFGLPLGSLYNSQECGWVQIAFIDDLSWVGAPIAWLFVNVFIIKSINKKSLKTANNAIKKDA